VHIGDLRVAAFLIFYPAGLNDVSLEPKAENRITPIQCEKIAFFTFFMPWLHGMAVSEKLQFMVKIGHFLGSEWRWFCFKILKIVLSVGSSACIGEILFWKKSVSPYRGQWKAVGAVPHENFASSK
jgi:hypothetical protein